MIKDYRVKKLKVNAAIRISLERFKKAQSNPAS